MNKYKIFVETKSRSKVVINFESPNDHAALRGQVLDAMQTDSFIIGDYVFKSSNVNYVSVESVD